MERILALRRKRRALKERINYSAIESTIRCLRIVCPVSGYHIENIFKHRLDLAQLVYRDNSYYINKYYLAIDGVLEIVLDSHYNFCAVNIRENDLIYSYDKEGILKSTYSTSQDKDIFWEKSNGDIYYNPNRIIGDLELDAFKDSWGDYLFCYSLKPDRKCFYITLEEDLPYKIGNEIFTNYLQRKH